MTNIESKGWYSIELLQYIYDEPLEEEFKKNIDNEIEKGNLELMEVILGLEKIQILKKFKSSKEHHAWMDDLEEQYLRGFSQDATQNTIDESILTAPSISKKAWIIIAILTSIIIVGGIMWFNQNKNVEPPIQEQQEPQPIASILEEELNTFPQIALIGKTRSSGDSVLNKIHELIYIQKDYNSANEIILNEIKKGGENESIFQYTIGLSYLRIGDVENSIRYLQMVANSSESIYKLDAKEQLIYAFIKNEQYNEATILMEELKEIGDYQEKMELLEMSLTKYRKGFQ